MRSTSMRVALLTSFSVLWFAPTQAQVTIFSETFDALPLLDSVDEGVAGPVGDAGGTAAMSVWTDVPPAGWVDDDTAVPGSGNAADDNGVFEWAGWSFADRDWWVQTAGDQNRSEFISASGTIMVADPDEWDDAPHPGGPPKGPWYDAFISTPPISLAGVSAGTAVLDFDSSWRPEFDLNFHQTANLVVSFDGGPAIEILRWESDPLSAFFHADATDEHLTIPLNNPAAASQMVLTFGLFDAGNDWWWAIDNVEITGERTPTATPTSTATSTPTATPTTTPSPAPTTISPLQELYEIPTLSAAGLAVLMLTLLGLAVAAMVRSRRQGRP